MPAKPVAVAVVALLSTLPVVAGVIGGAGEDVAGVVAAPGGISMELEPAEDRRRAGETFVAPCLLILEEYRVQEVDCRARLGGERRPDGPWVGGVRLAGRPVVEENTGETGSRGGVVFVAVACAWDVPRAAAGATLGLERGGYGVLLADPHGGRGAEILTGGPGGWIVDAPAE